MWKSSKRSTEKAGQKRLLTVDVMCNVCVVVHSCGWWDRHNYAYSAEAIWLFVWLSNCTFQPSTTGLLWIKSFILKANFFFDIWTCKHMNIFKHSKCRAFSQKKMPNMVTFRQTDVGPTERGSTTFSVVMISYIFSTQTSWATDVLI